jgi:VWFA-related protein
VTRRRPLAPGVLAVVAATVAAPIVAGTGAESPPPAGTQFPASASAVVLDVVVRDGKGEPVHGLTAADFEVIEDGAPQAIQAFHAKAGEPHRTPARTDTAVRPDAAAPPAASLALPAPAAPGTAPAVTAFVFDRLSPPARAAAHHAAVAATGTGDRLAGVAGVFAVDVSLRTLQPYTGDAALVRQALDRAASLSTASFVPESKTNPSVAHALSSLIPHEPAVHSADNAASVVADDQMGELEPLALSHLSAQEKQWQLMVARSLRRMEVFHQALAREKQGFATTNALLSVVASLGGLPGRKSVVFFSEGLALPTAVQPQVRSVIDAATRGGVSLYAVDTAGLRVTSTLAESRSEIHSYSARKARALPNMGGIALPELELNEDALQRDPQAALEALADQTGGFLVRDTNDLGPGLRRIDEDMRDYYVLAYTPTNQDYDGRFRRVAVRVRAKGLRVRTRKGYYAVRAESPGPILPYEAPALAMLGRTPRPRAFRMRVAGLSFPEPAGGRRVPVLVSVPARGLAYKVEGESYRAEFVIVARVKGPDGTVLRKLGQPYELRGPMSQLESVRASDVLFYRETSLPPGRFGLEAVVYDALAREAAVAESELVVPADTPAQARASSLVIVKAAERLASGQRASGALTVGDVLVYPVVEEPLSRSRPLLSFFFTTCVPAGAPAPAARVELLRDGEAVEHSSVALPDPDADGCLRHLAGLPIEGLPAGGYELRLVLGEGEKALVRSARFELAE